MVSRSARLRVGLVASFVLGAASATAQQPARGRVGYASTVSYPSAFDGEGNTPQTRETFLRLGLFARAIGDDPLQVAMATSRIEVCTVEVGQIVTCPGTQGFVLYDDTETPAVSLLPGISTKEQLAAAIRTADATGTSLTVPIPDADWGVPATTNNNLVYFLRVNGEPIAFAPAPGGKKQLPAALRDGGWAGQPRRFGTPDARFFGFDRAHSERGRRSIRRCWRFAWVGDMNAGGAEVSAKSPLTRQFASAPPPPTPGHAFRFAAGGPAGSSRQSSRRGR